jgi:hypothetical protein
MNREEVLGFIKNALKTDIKGTQKYSGNVSRAVFQGFSYGFGDEAEAFVRSVVGEKTYKENLGQIRSEIKKFRKDFPADAVMSEIGGAVPTTFASAVGLAKLGLKSPHIIAMTDGFLYGFGAGEDGVRNRASQGTLSSVLSGGLSRFLQGISPSKEAQELMKKGVKLSIGQQYGGAIQKVEDALKNIPFSGQSITNTQMKALKSYNNMLLDEALKPIGGKVNSKGSMIENHNQAQKLIAKAYQEVITPDLLINDANILLKNFDDQIDDLVLSEQATKNLKKLITKVVKPRIKVGVLSGQDLKFVESDLTNLITKLSKGSSGQKEVGFGLSQLQNTLRTELMTQNPFSANQLKDVNTAFRNFVPITNAVNKGLAKDGNFTAFQLLQSIRGADKSARKTSTASGEMPLQDLARAGQKTIGNVMPDSGTTERVLTTTGLLGGYPLLSGGYIDPLYLTAPIIQRGLYTDLGQELSRKVLNIPNVKPTDIPLIGKYLPEQPLSLMQLTTPSAGGMTSREEGLLGTSNYPLY